MYLMKIRLYKKLNFYNISFKTIMDQIKIFSHTLNRSVFNYFYFLTLYLTLQKTNNQ